jgi:CDP-diacylglycerol--serine O-phosphatidyltransferase
MIKMLSLADIITIMNAILGFLAILMIFTNQFQLAAAFILLGLLADGLDGIVARRIGNGQMGEYLETIGDSLTLSFAPLALLYKMYYVSFASSFPLHLVISIILIANFICSMLRLSSFSVMKNPTFFIGLPTAGNAIFLVLSSFLNLDIIYLLPFIVLFALLMICPIRFPKHQLKIDCVAAVFIIAAILLNFIYTNIAPLLLLFGLALYIIFGPLYLLRKNKATGTVHSHNR